MLKHENISSNLIVFLGIIYLVKMIRRRREERRQLDRDQQDRDRD
jgi:hypothetical protein